MLRVAEGSTTHASDEENKLNNSHIINYDSRIENNAANPQQPSAPSTDTRNGHSTGGASSVLSSALSDFHEYQPEQPLAEGFKKTDDEKIHLSLGMQVNSPAGRGVVTHLTLSSTGDKIDQVTIQLENTGGPKTYYKDEDIALVEAIAESTVPA